MTIVYNADDLGTLRTVVRVRHTMIALVVQSPAFWLLMIFHAVLLWVDRRSDYQIPYLHHNASGILTSLLTFFLVFYGSNAFARMNMFYDHCMGLAACILEWAALLKNHFTGSKSVRWNAMRLCARSTRTHTHSTAAPPSLERTLSTLPCVARLLAASSLRCTYTTTRSTRGSGPPSASRHADLRQEGRVEMWTGRGGTGGGVGEPGVEDDRGDGEPECPAVRSAWRDELPRRTRRSGT